MNKIPDQTKFGLSGSTLKCIALITMLIDHIGATIVEGILNRDYPAVLSNDSYRAYLKSHAMLISADQILRGIGRIAFPIFCFLLVEGFLHTKNKKKYALRLFLFALISEIPFDIAFRNTWFSFTAQNVFFTLFFGLLMIWLLDIIRQKSFTYPLIQATGYLIIIVAFMGIAYQLRVDYSSIGIAAIAAIYLLRNNRLAGSLAACLLLCIFYSNEIPCLLSVFLIGMYNGTRGLNLKYLFYAFYPIHLTILYVICMVTGIYSGTKFFI